MTKVYEKPQGMHWDGVRAEWGAGAGRIQRNYYTLNFLRPNRAGYGERSLLVDNKIEKE